MERLLREHALKPEPENVFDILEERRRGSDISHALRTFSAQPYRGATPLSVSALNRMVQESQYLRYVISEIAVESGEPHECVKEEAVSILEEMSQNLQLSFIRLMGFALTKVFKRLFSSIRVNEDGLARLQQAIQEHPVILMPNHRSYIDFLILSYIMFTYDLSIPVIAAGIPLMGMSLIGEILRRSGAFFIRRAIGSDKLYWAVLSEYVRTIVRTGFAPLEFYVEGLRSRTLKSLKPKLGMMQMVLEPFFKGEVYDITLVPISISYDRVLEESLLAHELLGVPKPRETTRGLLKARQVLEENYGCMHVYFGKPVSVRELAKGRIHRGQYNLIPRDLPLKLSAELQEFVSDVAHLLVQLQERDLVLSPWTLMALILLQNPDGVEWNTFTHKTLRLRTFAAQLGARIDWPAQLPDSEVMLSSMALHHSLARFENGHVRLVEEAGPGPVTQQEAVFRRASAVLMCASYRNQALHVFTRPALVAVAMTTAPSYSKDDVFSRFCFLQDLLANEFIFMPGHAAQDFEEGCSGLLRCGALSIYDHGLRVIEEEQDTIVFLSAVLKPFIETYQVVFRVLCEETFQTFTEKRFVPDARAAIMKLFLSGEVRSYECLSSDTQKNALSALVRMGAVSKSRVAEQFEYRVNHSAVRRIWDTLDGSVTSKVPLYSRL
ncbi:dihydroxyacetone phosphate acyltransferase isoform X2 [Pangasianodon hypophthalmus]|uniref:dihydroxyacetone phosphate acyltransferase isoform X2 n=1 Tax=Pangasianodon hypophthalmus TaxID=310915 RepID=UPI002307ED64|nr:dihydroxyacetone phosphate acyltransferase isoform X2 [Pangasianodon hypophthalmus]